MKPIEFNNILKPILVWYGDNEKLSKIKSFFLFKGYSLWWSSNLIKKDIYINNEWFVNLFLKISGKSLQRSNLKIKKKSFLFLIYLLFFDMYRYMLTRIFITFQKSDPNKIFFYSLELNIKKYNDTLVDRHLGDLPKQSIKYNLDYTYLLSLSKREMINPYTFFKNISAYNKMKDDIVFLDRYINLYDILYIHFKIIYLYIKFQLVKKKSWFRNSFYINQYNCNQIMISELDQSFFGTFQESLYTAFCFSNWSKHLSKKIIIVNTLENLAAMRAIYFFTRKRNPKCKFLSIQHSEINFNKIDFVNNKSEFNNLLENNCSPMTDYYFVHGEKSYKVVNEYMPQEKIFKIGCVKYDHFVDIKNQQKKIKYEISKSFNTDGKYVILIAPSIGVDFENVLNVIKEIDFKKYFNKNVLFILSPHLLFDKKIVDEYIVENQLSEKLVINYDYPTNKIILSCNLLITGYSSMALESLIFGVQSIRILPKYSIPLFDEENEIPIIENIAQLEKEIDYQINKNVSHHPKSYSNIIEDYFYKIDGSSSLRFWKKLREIV